MTPTEGTAITRPYTALVRMAEHAVAGTDLPIVIRPALPKELRFVQASWGRRVWARGHSSLLAYDDQGKTDAADRPYASLGAPTRGVLIDAKLLARAHLLLVDEILAGATVQIAVATLPDIDEPMGWACWDGPVLHYVFIRDDCRRQRVAARLIDHTGCSAASHVTPEGRGLLRHLRGHQ